MKIYWSQATFSVDCWIFMATDGHLCSFSKKILKVWQVLFKQSVLCSKCCIIKFKFIVLLWERIKLNLQSIIVGLLFHSRTDSTIFVLHSLLYLFVLINVIETRTDIAFISIVIYVKVKIIIIYSSWRLVWLRTSSAATFVCFVLCLKRYLLRRQENWIYWRWGIH